MPNLSKDEFMAKVQEIGTCEDDVQRKTLLTELSTGVSGIFDDNDTLAKSNKQYEQDNEILRKANMEFWLKSTGNPNAGANDGDGADDQDPEDDKDEKLDFKDLFNDKGELK